jgi:hypothetical protein
MGKTLMRRYRSALADRNVQVEGHRGLSALLADETVQKWESICVARENDNFPKKMKNPYHTEGIGKSMHASVSLFILRVIPLSPYRSTSEEGIGHGRGATAGLWWDCLACRKRTCLHHHGLGTGGCPVRLSHSQFFFLTQTFTGVGSIGWQRALHHKQRHIERVG